MGEFAAEFGMNYPVLVAEQAGLDAAAAFGIDVLALPISVLVGADGVVLAKLTGELDHEQADEWLRMAGIQK